jgi:hypothetical protein
MTLIGIIVFMFVATILGRRTPRPGFKQYLAIFLVTLLQVAVAVYQLLTMKMPPLR